MENGELQMRDGWSEHHRAVAEREIDELEKKVAALKRDIEAMLVSDEPENASEPPLGCA